MAEPTTPRATIVRSLGLGTACIIELPVNNHYVICETTGLPGELGFPLMVPRVYTVVGIQKSSAHAHKLGTEQEIMYVAAGCAQVWLWDNKGDVAMVELRPALPGERFKAVFVPAGTWHTVRYDKNTALNVVASAPYDRGCYIEEPEQFFTDEGLTRYWETFPH